MAAAHRVSFKTVGCRLNKAETAKIRAGFQSSGFAIVPFGSPVAVCVIHTCAVTAAAEKECIRLARSVKRKTPDTLVILAGCAAEIGGARLQAVTGADIIAGQDLKFDLPALIPQACPTKLAGRSRAARGQTLLPLFDTTRAWIKAQDGCSFECAYCIVPAARGPSRSRPWSDIVEEVRALADRGYREVVITGANLGCYRDGNRQLVDILSAIERIDGVRRMRVSSLEISTTERDIVEYMADSPKLCNFLHLPLQTGDDRLLEAMGRRHTSRQYRDLIAYAVDRIPLAGIGTDLVTGLPGEDEAAFANTMAIVRDLPFSNLHVFPYSRREGTRAASMRNQVPRDVAGARAAELIALGKEKRQAFANRFVGRQVEMLIEQVDEDGTARGWTGEYVQACSRGADPNPNQIVTFTPHTAANATLSER